MTINGKLLFLVLSLSNYVFATEPTSVEYEVPSWLEATGKSFKGFFILKNGERIFFEMLVCLDSKEVVRVVMATIAIGNKQKTYFRNGGVWTD